MAAFITEGGVVTIKAASFLLLSDADLRHLFLQAREYGVKIEVLYPKKFRPDDTSESIIDRCTLMLRRWLNHNRESDSHDIAVEVIFGDVFDDILILPENEDEHGEE